MGFDTNLFVDTQEELGNQGVICAFCLGVWENPTLVCSNSHVFCGACIQQWHNLNHRCCPECRSNLLQQRPVVRQLQASVDQRQVKCPNPTNNNDDDEEDSEPPTQRPRVEADPEDRCTWTGSLQEYVNTHKGNCQFRKRRCPHCHLDILERDFEEHANQLCPHRRVSCPLCNARVAARGLVVHRDTVCPEQEMGCPFDCGARLRRRELGGCIDISDDPENYTGHWKDCPAAPIPCKYGCAERIPRNAMEQHCQTHQQAHLDLVMARVQKLEAERSQRSLDDSWQKVSFAWSIPCPKIRAIRQAPPPESVLIRRIRSQPHTAGEFKVSLVLEVNEFSHRLRFQVHVDNPQGYLLIRKISFRGDGIQVRTTEHPQGMSPHFPHVDLPVLLKKDDGDELVPCLVDDLVDRASGNRLRFQASFWLKYNNDVGTV